MIVNRRKEREKRTDLGAKRTNSAYRKEIRLWLIHEPHMYGITDEKEIKEQK